MAHNAGSNNGLNEDDAMEVVDEHLHEKPLEALKMKPKKSILKNRGNSIEEKHCERPDDSKAHFDEMNILATYHPADKDYGHMKVRFPLHFIYECSLFSDWWTQNPVSYEWYWRRRFHVFPL